LKKARYGEHEEPAERGQRKTIQTSELQLAIIFEKKRM
jgi:hypothetical protein